VRVARTLTTQRREHAIKYALERRRLNSLSLQLTYCPLQLRILHAHLRQVLRYALLRIGNRPFQQCNLRLLVTNCPLQLRVLALQRCQLLRHLLLRIGNRPFQQCNLRLLATNCLPQPRVLGLERQQVTRQSLLNVRNGPLERSNLRLLIVDRPLKLPAPLIQRLVRLSERGNVAGGIG
jgi:hypothetical protein